MPLIDVSLWPGWVGGELVGGNMARSFSGAQLNRRSGVLNQLIAGGTAVDVEWGEAEEDVGGWANLNPTTTFFTVPAGVTRVRTMFVIRINGNFTINSTIIMRLLQNGLVIPSTGIAGYNIRGGLLSSWTVTSPAFDVVAGDELAVNVSLAPGVATATIPQGVAAGIAFGIEAVTIDT